MSHWLQSELSFIKEAMEDNMGVIMGHLTGTSLKKRFILFLHYFRIHLLKRYCKMIDLNGLSRLDYGLTFSVFYLFAFLLF